MSKTMIKKSIDIEDSLKKIGWETEVSFSGKDSSNSFYITISKELETGIWDKSCDGKDIFLNDTFEKKIRFSDHELPSYYPLADYECRFDINGAAWNELKPKIKKLYSEICSQNKLIKQKKEYVQGVCECVIAVGDNHDLGKKLLTEMKVDKEMARKFAKPETFKTLEKGIFVPNKEQIQEQIQTIKR